MRSKNPKTPLASSRDNIPWRLSQLASKGIVAAALVIVSSAPARAGFRYFSLNNSSSAANHSDVASAAPRVDFGTSLTSLTDQLPDDSSDSSFLPSASTGGVAPSTVDMPFSGADPITQVNNATPAANSTPPLLIPVPSAISSGLCGLIVLALLATPRRLRRRLFE